MIVMYVLSMMMATSSFVAVNPMSSALYFVMAIVLLLPVMSGITYIWVAYLVALLFMSGVFVLLVYFAGLSKVYYKPVSGALFLLLGHVFVFPLFPFILAVPLDLDMSFLYEPEQLLVIVFVVLVLLGYLTFVSYFLGSGSSIRRL